MVLVEYYTNFQSADFLLNIADLPATWAKSQGAVHSVKADFALTSHATQAMAAALLRAVPGLMERCKYISI